MSDRRSDSTTRTRVDEIGQAYERSLESIQTWVKRIVVLICLISFAGVASIPVYSMYLQSQRLQAVRESCLANNDTMDAIVRIVIRFDSSPQAIQSVRRELPRRSDCEQYARKTVTSFGGILLMAGDPVTTPPPPELTPSERSYCGRTCFR